MVDRRDTLSTEIGTVYGPPPTRNVVPGGVTMTCAEPTTGEDESPGVGGGVYGAGGAGGGSCGAGAGTGAATAGAVAGAAAAAFAVFGGTTTVPGTGDEPGGGARVTPPGIVLGVTPGCWVAPGCVPPGWAPPGCAGAGAPGTAGSGT